MPPSTPITTSIGGEVCGGGEGGEFAWQQRLPQPLRNRRRSRRWKKKMDHRGGAVLGDVMLQKELMVWSSLAYNGRRS